MRSGFVFHKRSDVVAEEIKLWIIEHNMLPGHRLPPEKELIDLFGVSKGTMREALKALEVQGLIRIAMGPGGGAGIIEVTVDRAMSLLAPYFYYRAPTIADIYQVRILLEPEMAVSAVGNLTPQQLAELEQLLDRADRGGDALEEGRRHRLAEISFHEVISEACPNPWLSFACKFMLKLLKDIVVIDRIYEIPMQEMSHANHCSHEELVKAFRAGERDSIRRIMEQHMREAADHMRRVEGQLDRRRFLRPS